MALSQKHQNLILVPWYNIEEWKHVYRLAYSGGKTEQGKALEILKIWKIRTPILAAGIEGTLIILDALLLDSGEVPEDRLQELYSVALMRFLNLSAAHNDKQGTFYKTAIKNGLPKWLINLRHDIAHGHSLPAKSMLEMGLVFGMSWLQEKYWEVQCSKIEDYIVQEVTGIDYFEKVLKEYIHLKMSIFKGVDPASIKVVFLQNITDLVCKKLHRDSVQGNDMFQILEELLKTTISHNRNEDMGKLVADIIVDERFLLFPEFEFDESSNMEKISKNFRDIWTKLLNILHDNKWLFFLVDRLFDATGDITVGDSSRKMASYWLCEIFLSLIILKLVKAELKDGVDSMVSNDEEQIKSKLRNNPSFKEYIELDGVDYIYLEEAKKFESKVMHLPNEYTLNYLQIVLQFNNRTDVFIRDALHLVKNTVSLKSTEPIFFENIDEEIHTLEELTLNMSFKDDDENFTNNFWNGDDKENRKNNYLSVESSFGNKRWKTITDTSSFKGYPIGVLPHQNRNESPVVRFYK